MGGVKVWEETWEASPAAVHLQHDDATSSMVLLAEGPEERSHPPTLELRDAARALDAARARLAAAAPDLVRALLSLGCKPCPSCERWNDCDECCLLDAALRKAGVR